MSEYPYPLHNEAGKVLCQLCGKPFLVISPKHLTTKHNIKHDEYRLRFPDAPLSSEAFGMVTKYGKNKTIFVENEMSKFEEEVTFENENVEEIQVNEPEIDEAINLSSILSSDSNSKDIMSVSKNKILDHLKSYFTNIQKDYLIEQYGPDERLKFVFITDFCDPILKIVIQFPKTFWHNREQALDLNKNQKLKQYGWKVIEFQTMSPSLKDIDEKINSL
jgi:hypothetical protein